MKLSLKDFFNKCDQIRIFGFCAVRDKCFRKISDGELILLILNW